MESLPEKVDLTICGLGFYRLFLNGKEITNGHLAPFQSNPDQILYYDVYDLKGLIQAGENVIGVLLGNAGEGFVKIEIIAGEESEAQTLYLQNIRGVVAQVIAIVQRQSIFFRRWQVLFEILACQGAVSVESVGGVAITFVL